MATTFLDHACTATRMLEKRRQLFEVQEALESQKDEFARKGDAFRRREEALRRKDLKLQESLIKFNKFLQENESKRTRADKRCADESRQREAKEKEIVKLKRVLEEKVAEEKQLAEQLARNIRYHHFLSTVVDSVQGASDDFREVQDVLDRYSTLMKTNADLLQRQQENVAENEAKRASFINFMKEKGDTILNHNNEIASLQKELETQTLATSSIQTQVDAAERGTTEKISDLGQILAAIDNLLERFESNKQSRQKGGGHRDNEAGEVDANEAETTRGLNAIANLEKIAEYMEDYKSIVDEWEQSKNNEQNSTQG